MYNLVLFRYPSTTWSPSYLGEICRLLSVRVVNQPDNDMKSQIVRFCLNSNQEIIKIKNFTILSMGYNKITFKRRISEALFVKQYFTSLSV